MRPSLTVMKLGGSLVAGRRLRPLLASLAACRDCRLVLVPGGGVLAEAVRTLQAEVGFDDALAHRLALDAMGGMAEILAAVEPRLAVVRDRRAIDRALRTGWLPIWDPAALRPGCPDIPESWSVTSDSLALWLAAQLGAGRLVLVKSRDAPPGATPTDLATSGIVDKAFPAFAARFRGAILVHGPRDGENFRRVLGADGLDGSLHTEFPCATASSS